MRTKHCSKYKFVTCKMRKKKKGTIQKSANNLIQILSYLNL